MHILLFIFYSAILCYAIQRIPFFRNSRIRPRMLLLLFGLRVACGCLHNLIAYRFFPNHGDIWAFFRTSFVTRQELFTDFHRFLADNSTWAYMPYNTLMFIHVLFNFLSFDNLYINTLFFSFFVFWGNIALFRFFRDIFNNSLLCGCCTLFIPSTLFWTSCIHKEGLLYLVLGFFYYHLYKGIRNGWNTKKVLVCLLLFCIAAFFRGNMIVTLLPALALWVLWLLKEKKGSGKPVKIVIGALLGTVLILFIVRPAVFPGILSLISERQRLFQALEGNSRIHLPLLEPTLGSFLHALPVAVLNGFFQPLPGIGGQLIYLAFSIELILVWLVVIYSLYWWLSNRSASNLRSDGRLPSNPGFRSGQDPRSASDFRSGGRLPSDRGLRSGDGPQSASGLTGFGLSCLLFSFCGMLLIGYTIPFAGTIVRYRSIYLPFLLTPYIYILRHQPLFEKLNYWLSRHFVRPDPDRPSA